MLHQTLKMTHFFVLLACRCWIFLITFLFKPSRQFGSHVKLSINRFLEVGQNIASNVWVKANSNCLASVEYILACWLLIDIRLNVLCPDVSIKNNTSNVLMEKVYMAQAKDIALLLRRSLFSCGVSILATSMSWFRMVWKNLT